ncbi:MAG TPA: hypothetical protein ENJ95_18820 [Bacteroidetes bacterium]|nr:hypothetical protein [Bacteroidota bacterium]
MSSHSSSQFKFNGILGVVLLVAFFVGIFFIMSGIFWVLKWVAPVMLVAAFIIDRSVVTGYVKWLIDTVKSNPLFGIGAIVFTIIGYMVVFPFLLAKALFKKKVKEVTQDFENRQQGEFVDYEEVSSEPKKEETLELPRLERMERRQQKRNDYDNMFE